MGTEEISSPINTYNWALQHIKNFDGHNPNHRFLRILIRQSHLSIKVRQELDNLVKEIRNKLKEQNLCQNLE